MPVYQKKPRLNDVRAGTSVRIYFHVRNARNEVVNFTGGSGSVNFTPRQGGDSFGSALTLNSDPSAEPQFYFDVQPEETGDLSGFVDGMAIISAGGKVFKFAFFFRVLPGS